MRDPATLFTLELPGGQCVTVQKGSNLLAVLQQAGIPVASPCGGRGTCAKCRVRLEFPAAEGKNSETYAACRYGVESDLRVSIPPGHLEGGDTFEFLAVAGEFGGHLRAEDMNRLGFFPRFPSARFVFPGNTCLNGLRRLALVESSDLRPLEGLIRLVAPCPLSQHPGYPDIFVECLRFF